MTTSETKVIEQLASTDIIPIEEVFLKAFNTDTRTIKDSIFDLLESDRTITFEGREIPFEFRKKENSVQFLNITVKTQLGILSQKIKDKILELKLVFNIQATDKESYQFINAVLDTNNLNMTTMSTKGRTVKFKELIKKIIELKSKEVLLTQYLESLLTTTH